MSYYSNRTNGVGEDDPGRRFSRLRSNRIERNGGFESNPNTNNSNNNESSKTADPRISSYSRNAAEYSHRQLGSRTSVGPRRKSALVESMAANFEQKNTAPVIKISNTPVTNKSSINGIESKNSLNKRTTMTSAKLENGTHLKPDNEDDSSTSSPRQKSGLSARRGKQQREKRMLRQKRRSTGVVRLKESDDEEDNKESKEKSDKTQEKEKEEETVLHLSETELNTRTNELSPPPVTHDRSPTRNSTRDASPVSSPNLTSPMKQQSSSIRSSYSYQSSTSDSVFNETSVSNSSMPTLNSSRRRFQRNSSEKLQQDVNDKREMEELRSKLSAAEATVTKLTKEIEEMDADLTCLEEENGRLKKENKMLEDENLTMLRLIKR